MDILNLISGGALGAPPSWDNLVDGKFGDMKFHVATPNGIDNFGMESEEVVFERRLQIIKRPGVDGASVRDFGAGEETYTANLVFFGPGYAQKFEAFKTYVNDGVARTLTLPDEPGSKNAVFWKMSRSAGHQDGQMKRVTVTWVQDTEPVVLSGADLKASSPLSGLSSVTGALSSAKVTLTNNPFLTAVRGAESILSTVKSAVNTVTQLTAGVKNRILQIEADVTGTISLVESMVSDLQTLFTGSQPVSSAAQQAGVSNDPDTGQRIASITEPDSPAAPVSVLTAPAIQPVLPFDINTTNLANTDVVLASTAAVVSQMQAEVQELNLHSGGRTDDVTKAITIMINALNEYIATVTAAKTQLVVTNSEMSLIELMFANGITSDQLRVIHSQNTQITNPCVIPPGTVVSL